MARSTKTPRKDGAVTARDRYSRATWRSLRLIAEDILLNPDACDFHTHELGAYLSVIENAEGQDWEGVDAIHEVFELLYDDPKAAARKVLKDLFGESVEEYDERPCSPELRQLSRRFDL